MTAVLCGFALFLNIILFVFGNEDSEFRYATTWFSLSNLTANLDFILVCALVIVALLFSGEKKNGTLKNSLAYGVSRNDMFVGKCIVCSIAGMLSMIVILVVYIASSYLLLDNTSILPMQILLKGICFTIPSAIASIVLAVTLFSICDSEITAIIWWLGIMYLVPTIFYYIGFRVELFSLISEWMPENFLSKEVAINLSGYDCLWDTSYGAIRCLVSGIAGILVFGVIGMTKFNKKDIS